MTPEQKQNLIDRFFDYEFDGLELHREQEVWKRGSIIHNVVEDGGKFYKLSYNCTYDEGWDKSSAEVSEVRKVEKVVTVTEWVEVGE